MRRFKPILLIAGLTAFGVAFAIGASYAADCEESLASDSAKDRCLGLG